MADYIYLLENRLSAPQRSALRAVREVARARNLTVFLVGGAVRDLTSGSPVRDLDVVVVGNALKLKKELEKAGAVLDGENDAAQALFVRFGGNVRMEVGSALSATFPKAGKAVYKQATILEDLRRRDFTANAMALSLNDGSYGLLMDPLNGIADIENRELRLVSNYGFIDDPVRMIRAARLMARLGWTLDEKTQTRYETGKQEGYISAMPEAHRGYETEEIIHEEDPMRVLKRLESEGWMKHLAPFWTSDKVNLAELDRLRETQTQLQMQGVHPDMSAASFPLLTARLSAKEIASLKAGFPRRGFAVEIDAAEAESKELATQLTGKTAALPSQAWRLLTTARPETVLQLAFSSKAPAIQAKFKSFYTEWPQSRQKMPYALLTEMRIIPDLPGYEDLLEKLFFELMDGNLSTPEELKAFLEPFSPPAPPPPVSLRRPRAAKKEAKGAKSRAKKVAKLEEADADEEETEPEITDDIEDVVIDLDAGDDKIDDTDDEDDDEDEDDDPPPPLVKAAAKKTTPAKVAPVKPAPAKPAPAKPAPAKSAPVKTTPASPVSAKAAPVKAAPAKAAPVKPAPAKAAPVKAAPVKAAPAKAAPAKAAPAKKASVKAAPAKVPVKAAPAAKSPAKKSAPAKAAAPAKKAAAPPAKKAPATAVRTVPAKGKKSVPPAKAARKR